MSLVDHARYELDRCGQTAEDPMYAQSIISAIAALVSYGHSGGSMAAAIGQLMTLLQYRTLSPLTSDPDEWFDHGSESGTPLCGRTSGTRLHFPMTVGLPGTLWMIVKL